MKTINLRWIYPHYRQDEFVEVSDEVWEVMRQAQREMNNYERRKVYHRAYYSLDAYSWTENYALEHSRSPEEILLEREDGPPICGCWPPCRRPCPMPLPPRPAASGAYYIAGISQPEISRREGVDSSKVSVAIRRGLRNMRRCLTAFSRQSEGGPMQTINLKQYYPFCTEDTFVEVSDEIVKRSCWTSGPRPPGSARCTATRRFTPLTAMMGLRTPPSVWAQPSPEDCLMEKEAQAEYAELLRRLYEAISSLPPAQAPPRPCPVYAGDESEGHCRDGGHYPIPGWEVHPCGAPAAAPVLHTPGNGQAAYENHQPEKILLPDL